MIKIVKGNLVNIVSKSAFDNFFKSQGWEVLKGDFVPPAPAPKKETKKQEIVEEIPEEEVNEDEWDEALDELQDDEAEKPLSEMNKEELVAKATNMGIDVTDLTTNKQLREAIKSFK